MKTILRFEQFGAFYESYLDAATAEYVSALLGIRPYAWQGGDLVGVALDEMCMARARLECAGYEVVQVSH